MQITLTWQPRQALEGLNFSKPVSRCYEPGHEAGLKGSPDGLDAFVQRRVGGR